MRAARILIVLIAFGLCGAQAASPADDQAALRQIKEVEWPKAYREQDTELLDRLLAEEFQVIDADGAWSSKAAELDYIRAHPEIWEVILTGGDPFMLSARRAAALTRELEAIPHVKVIRWHTRMPVADPVRVSAEYVAAIRSKVKAVYETWTRGVGRAVWCESPDEAFTRIRELAA